MRIIKEYIVIVLTITFLSKIVNFVENKAYFTYNKNVKELGVRSWHMMQVQ